MSLATFKSRSIDAFWVVVLFSSSMYFTSDCCMFPNEWLNWPISSTRLKSGSSASNCPEAMASASLARRRRGFNSRVMMRMKRYSISSRPMVTMAVMVWRRRSKPLKMSLSGQTMAIEQPVWPRGL